MDNLDQIRETAIKAKEIINDFLQSMNEGDKKEFQSSFHLRPTSNKESEVTVVSTLAIAPMRGSHVKIRDLKDKLQGLKEILSEKDDDTKLQKLNEMGFGKRDDERDTNSILEEDIQAFLIRDMILYPKRYGGMQFVASELVLPETEAAPGKHDYRADVIAYKDGTLYDIELKKNRLTVTVTQAEEYVQYLKKNMVAFSSLLSKFPNCSIGEIHDVKGIALVPQSESGNSSGGLEKRGEESGVALWYFTCGFQICPSK